MLVAHVAVLSETKSLPLGEVCKASAALQKQVVRDFGPIWEIDATVNAFEKLEDVPIGYWPVIVRDDIGFNAAGIHLDDDGQPFALVQMSADWALTASHEVLEMLADPFGNRLVAGKSIMPGQGRVEYLVEVCDPSEANAFGYTVNGLQLSDFYTQSFFDPHPASGVQYSFTSAITKPRQVLRGGYLSWHDPVSDHWFQQTWFSGNRPRFRDLGVFSAAKGSFRSQIDALTNRETAKAVQKRGRKKLSLSAAARTAARENAPYTKSTNAKANKLRAKIAQLQAS